MIIKEKRVELHLHTRYSAMDALTDVQELISRAADEGWPAVAITDHSTIQAFPEAQQAAHEYGVKVIYGFEAHCFDDARESDSFKNYHVTILAKSQTGLRNLYELVSYANTVRTDRVPRIPRSVIDKHREGLLLGSACACGEIYEAVLSGKPPEELETKAQYFDYLEIQPICNTRFLHKRKNLKSDEELRQINTTIAKLAARVGKPLVATGDVHFLDPEDELAHGVLLSAMDIERGSAHLPLYFKSTEEMLAEFSYLGKEVAYAAVVTNPLAIADSIEELEPVPSGLYIPETKEVESEIKKACIAKAESLYGKSLPSLVKERLDRELSAIGKRNSWLSFAVAEKLVRRSAEQGYSVGTRGAVAASLVAYLLGITEINPLSAHYLCPKCRRSEFQSAYSYITGFDMPDKLCPICAQPMRKDGFNLPMETFFIEGNNKLLDIDLNFAREYRQQALEQLEEIFGSEHVFKACLVSTISEEQAQIFIRHFMDDNILRLSDEEIEAITSKLFAVKDEDVAHPSAYVIVPHGMSPNHFSPIGGCHDNRTFHFDFHYLHNCLFTVNILGHSAPSILKELEAASGINSRSIPPDDEKTFALLKTADTLGIPEFSSDFARRLLTALKPDSLSDLIKISGLSHGTGTWEGNAEELIEGKTASLGELIATRDDIYIFLVNAGMDPSEAGKVMEFVRMGKFYTGPDRYQSESRIRQCAELEDLLRRYNVPDWYIASMKKIRYLFPKAHTASYVLLSYRIAWYKAHYPLEFQAVMLNRFDAETALIGERQ